MKFRLLIILLGFSFSLLGQSVEKTTRKLDIIRKQIKEYEQKIQETEVTEKNSIQLLSDYEKQIRLIDALVLTLTNELRDLEKEIERSKNQLIKTEQELTNLKMHYASYVSSVYKRGKLFDLELIFSATDVNQFLVRMEYMKFFTDQRKRDLFNMVMKQKQISEQRVLLSEKYDKQKSFISQKLSEEKTIGTKQSQRQLVLDKAQKNKKQFSQLLEKQREEEERLQNQIARLIEEEEKKRALASESGMKSFSKSVDFNKSNTFDFSTLNPNYKMNKGRFPWPVENGVVISEYGKIYNKELKTTKNNPGIDIAVPEGTDVRVILDGVVKIIDFNPEHGQIVIVRHNETFLTAYARFSEVYVKVGDEVKAGTVIGKSGGANTPKGASIHFELWENKEPKDPQVWLANNQ